MDESNVTNLEGFLCPICKIDFFSQDELLLHFQEQHAEQDFYKSLFKDLFGKAKKKFLKPNGSPERPSQSQQGRFSNFNTSFEYEPNLDVGICTKHSEFFKNLRKERQENLAGPSNQIEIRLKKLLDNLPSDLIKKKGWEQDIVPWMDGTTVTRCPDCASQFHLAKRKHHCRTCGGIMCNNCSRFMPFNTVRRIVGRSVLCSDNASNSSEMHLRLCIHCLKLLEMRERKKEIIACNPIMGQIYNLLVESRTEAEQHLTSYLRMYHSLDAGESKYNLKDAQLLRVRLIKLAESIDTISDKIKGIGMKKEGTVEGKLCSGIRTAHTSYLCTNLLSLPNLPTEEELAYKQQRRSEKVQEEVERRRQYDMKQRQSSLASSEPLTPNGQQVLSQQEVVSMGQGWVPTEQTNRVNEKEDPLIEQMNIIRSYIKQAKLANRIDEVNSLEQNLEELKKEIWKRTKEQDEAPKSDEVTEKVKDHSPGNPFDDDDD